MQLNLIGKEKAAEEVVHQEREPTEDEGKKIPEIPLEELG
jgi:hypothetical protein